MNDGQRDSLRWFRSDTVYTNGKPIDWDGLDYETMWNLNKVREILGSKVLLIRGAHPGKLSALDACSPDSPLGDTNQVLSRLGECRYGVYAGDSSRSRTGSFHLDQEPYEGTWPMRWMAIKEQDEGLVVQMQLKHLISSRANGWTYLYWTGSRSNEALQLVFRLAAGIKTGNDWLE